MDKRDSNGLSRNFLTIGAGLKSPTGKNVQSSDPLKNLYPGTGSWDFLFLSNYTHQFNAKWGWQTEGSISIKGKDRFGYAYGNSFQLSSHAVLNKALGKYRIISALGINGEYHNAASLNSESAQISNSNKGYIFSGRMALNLITYRYLISFFFQQPIVQNINAGLTKQGTTLGINFNYLLNK